MVDFVHLHLHSEYSLLDGAARIVDIPKAVKAHGQRAVAITDHGVMYGAVEFYKACKEQGVKPIIGCEVYVAQGSRFDKKRTPDYFNCHLILLVKNETGYKNLIKMVSSSFIDGFYVKPRIDDELLSKYSEGLICLSGCLSGHISKALLKGDEKEAKDYAEKLLSYFGKENFYIELQDNKVPDQLVINSALAKLAREIGVSVVATNDVHYINKSDADTQAILTCIQTNSRIQNGRPLGFENDEFYLKSSEEMAELFEKYPEAILNTVKIADMCNFDFVFGKKHFPVFEVPNGLSASKYLATLAEKGLEKRINDQSIIFDEDHTKEDYVMRYKYELMIIAKMGYSEYYLIVWDFVSNAKARGITVGPGRGSGAGSLVAYLIGITDVDSIRYGLLFERFLNPERISMPDFDIDFRDDMRDEAIKYVADKYGRDRVAQIITFGTMAAKAAIRDVGRALGMPYADVDAVAKMIPSKPGTTIKEALCGELFELYETSDSVKRLVDIASSLEGMPRHASTHAAGVLITENALDTYVPLSMSGDTIVAQYDMDTIAELGLLKFDFLAVRYLTVVTNAENEIKRKNPDFSIEKIPLDDINTYNMLSEGDTDGIFQLESSGMRHMLMQMKPDCLSDIILAISLYRPGPMESIPVYLANRKKKLSIKYDIDCLADILDETGGVVIYQEQVMQICRKVANFSYGKADVVRKAMAKKRSADMEKERADFLRGAKDNFIDIKAATKLFDDMSNFAKYAFNKSHAASYALTSYRTAYLKANYPAQYYSALLSAFSDDTKISVYISNAKKHGVLLLPPDVTKSEGGFITENGNIRFGLQSIKGVGKTLADNIKAERNKKPFVDFSDFVERMAAYDMNKQQLTALVSVGAFDSFGIFRSKLLVSLDVILESVQSKLRNDVVGQIDMFSALSDKESSTLAFNYPDIPEIDPRLLMAMENEYLGLYLSGSLLDEYSECIKKADVTDIANLLLKSDELPVDFDEKRVYKIVGIISRVTRKNTKSGAVMAFFTIEDRTNEIEAIAFPKTVEKKGMLLNKDSAVMVTGNVNIKDEEVAKFMAFDIEPLITNTEQKKKDALDAANRAIRRNSGYGNQYSASKSEPVCVVTPKAEEKKPFTKIFIRVPDFSSNEYKRALALAEIFTDSGEFDAVFYDSSMGKYSKLTAKICLSDYIISEFMSICGKDNVILK